MKSKIRLNVLLALVVALLVCGAARADSYEATSMRLLRYEGSVEILDPTGASRFVLENVRFASGETLQTGPSSTASVGLDDVKIVTLDANSRVRFLQEGDHFRLDLLEGSILLDVQEKLDENESLDIQTANMTVGIRGTIVFVSETLEGNNNEPGTTLGVFEGTAQINFKDTSGANRLIAVPAGQKVAVEAQGAAGVAPVIEDMVAEDVLGFVRDTVVADSQLTQRVLEASEQGAAAISGVSIGVTSPSFDFPAEGEWTWDDPVTLVAQSASKLYDGTPLTRPSDVLVYGLPQGVNIDVAANGSQTDAGESSNPIAHWAIYNAVGQDVTARFTNVEIVSGRLHVDPAPVTVWTGSAEKYYDGEPLVCEDAELRTVPGHEEDVPTWRNTSIVTRSALGSESMVAVSGTTWVHGTNPLTGETRQIVLYTGQKLTVQLHSDAGKESIEFQIETMTVDELPDEVLRLYADNPALLEQACADAGWDIEELTRRIEALEDSQEQNVSKNGLQVAPSAMADLMRDSSNVRITIDTEITSYNSRALSGEEAHFTPIILDPSIKVIVTGSQTEVGESDNTYEIDWGTAKPSNYVLSEELGTLKVLPLREDQVVLQASSAVKTYDGTPLTMDSFRVSGLPVEEGVVYTVTATVEGSQTDAGEGINRVTEFHVFNDVGEDVTAQFGDIRTVSGVLRVESAPLTIATGSASKVYDGTPLTCAEVTVDGLVNGETVAVTATGAITEIGAAENTYTIDWGTVNSENYAITENLGALEVTIPEGAVLLTTESATKTYDGTALTSAGFTAAGLPSGFTVTAVVSGSRTDAGSSENTIASYSIFDGSGADVTAIFPNILIQAGTLTVEKAPLTITTGSAGKPYDGTPLTSAEATVTGLVNGQSITITATGTITEVGTAVNACIIDWGNTNSDNYAITETLGTLEITSQSAAITLTAGSAAKTYDGQPLTTAGVTADGIPTGFVFTAVATGSQTDAGVGANTVESYSIYDANGADVTANFANITLQTGTLTVEKAPLTIYTGSATKMYDGLALGSPEAFVTGLVNGENVSITATGAITEVGTAVNTYAIDWGAVNPDNYAITETLGTLEVTANGETITLTAGSSAKIYDGTPLTGAEYTVTGLPAGYTVTATFSGSQTDAGTSENIVESYSILDASGADVTGNYASIATVAGTLTVEKAPLTIATGSAGKSYDGTPLTNNEVTVTGLVNGESIAVTPTGEITEVGTADNTYTVDWGAVNSANYAITETLGTLEVTASAAVTLTAGSASKTYDGTPLTSEECTATGLPSGYTVRATFSGSQTDAGSSENTIEAYTILDAGGADVTANYAFSAVVAGTLTVEKAPLTVSTGSANKVYDGTALTSAEATVTGLASGESVTVTATGAITDAGTAENTYTLDWGGTNSANYAVTESLGALTVEKAPLTITTGSASKVYDGEALASSDVTVTGLADGDSITVTPNGTITDAGTADNTYTIDWGETKQSNYTMSDTLGTLTVEKLSLTLSCGGTTVTYDGGTYFPYATLTYNNGSHAGETVEGYLLEEVVPDFGFELFTGDTVTASISGIGSDAGTYTLAAATEYPAYATLGLSNQTLTVQPCPITVHTGSASKAQDGLPLYCEDGAYIEGLPDGVEIGIETTGSQTEVGSSTNTYELYWWGEDESNYTITEDLGTLTVTAWDTPIVITAGSATKMYDGTDLTCDEYEAAGLPDGWFVTATVSGSQHNVGTSANTVTDYTVFNADEEEVDASCYTASVVDGALEVTENTTPITVKIESGVLPYNGERHREYQPNVTCSYSSDNVTVDASAPTMTLSAYGIYDVEAPSVSFYDNQTGEDVTAYFTNVTTEGGYIDYHPLSVQANLRSETIPWDGQYHGVTSANFVFSNIDYGISFSYMWDTQSDTELDYDEWTLLWYRDDEPIMAVHFYTSRYKDPGTYAIGALRYEVEAQFSSDDFEDPAVNWAHLTIAIEALSTDDPG